MGKRKFLWVLLFLIIFSTISLVLFSPIYAGSYAGHSDGRLSDEQIEIIVLINNQRSENGAKNLWYSETLGEIANVRVNDMLERNYFSHYTPEGTNVFNLMDSWEIRASYRGENLARGEPSVVTPENVIEAWMKSKSHRDNLLRKAYRNIGVGIGTNGTEKIIVVLFTN